VGDFALCAVLKKVEELGGLLAYLIIWEFPWYPTESHLKEISMLIMSPKIHYGEIWKFYPKRFIESQEQLCLSIVKTFIKGVCRAKELKFGIR
jgi:hypothetical protein